MRCEDCKNYDKKDNGEMQELGSKILKLLGNFCIPKQCANCPLDNGIANCCYTQIREMLEKAGWKR